MDAIDYGLESVRCVVTETSIGSLSVYPTYLQSRAYAARARNDRRAARCAAAPGRQPPKREKVAPPHRGPTQAAKLARIPCATALRFAGGPNATTRSTPRQHRATSGLRAASHRRYAADGARSGFSMR
jgi:hypothetical protein